MNIILSKNFPEADLYDLRSMEFNTNEVSSNIAPQDLRARFLLQIARYSEKDIHQNQSLAIQEMNSIYSEIRAAYEDDDIRFFYDLKDSDLADFGLEESKLEDIELLIGKLHYLRSIRDNTLYLSVVNRKLNLTVGIVGLSSFDLDHLQITPYKGDDFLVLSRMYTINNLPFNINSYIIGGLLKFARKNFPRVKFFITYLNKNVGFTGTTYKATNWKLIAIEENTRYAYYKGQYVSDRFLIKNFGTCNENLLTHNDLISFSKIPLMPLEIYYIPLVHKLAPLKFQKTKITRR